MGQTYCGKNCADCNRKSELNCPGCRVGPGKPYGTECSIAKCAVTRGHHDCEVCTAATNCAILKSRDRAAEERYLKQAREKAELISRKEHTRELGQWLMVYFWLVIGSIIVNVVVAFMGEQVSPLAGELVSFAVAVAQALILIRLSSASYCFQMAGIFSLIYLALNLALNFAIVLVETEGLLIVLTLAGLVLSVLAAYQEYMGHAEVTEDINEKLSHKWATLWIQNFVCLCATAVSTIMTILRMESGIVVLLLSVVGVLVISIVKLVYLWDSVKTFRQYYEEMKYFV